MGGASCEVPDGGEDHDAWRTACYGQHRAARFVGGGEPVGLLATADDSAITELDCSAGRLAEQQYIGGVTLQLTLEVDLGTDAARLTRVRCGPGLP